MDSLTYTKTIEQLEYTKTITSVYAFPFRRNMALN